MHEIKADFIKNRLYITLRESDRTDMNSYVNEIEHACKELTPGFTCITFFPGGKVPQQKYHDLLMNTKDLIYAYGAVKIVRVGKSGRASSLVKSAGFNMMGNIKVEDAATIQEAEKILDGMTKTSRIQK